MYDSNNKGGLVPSYEDIVIYASRSGLLGKVSTKKFYEYYKTQNFMYRGSVMDWKTKLHEWASRQKSAVIVTAAEYEIVQKARRPVGGADEDNARTLALI